jgi:hypothetical protein
MSPIKILNRLHIASSCAEAAVMALEANEHEKPLALSDDIAELKLLLDAAQYLSYKLMDKYDLQAIDLNRASRLISVN